VVGKPRQGMSGGAASYPNTPRLQRLDLIKFPRCDMSNHLSLRNTKAKPHTG